jgi:hypothetical protein
MLSSILQQKGDLPEIVTSISFVPNNGNPTTESVIDLFSNKGLDIVRLPLELNQVSNRAIPRNMRVQATNADWILFADSDMVYSVDFFEDIKRQLATDQFKNETKVIGADRHSLDDKFCIKYFEEDKTQYPCIIENVADIAAKWPKKWIRGKGTAAGYFQLARVQAIKDKGGVYTHARRDHWRHTKSDRGFRCQMGGRVPMDTKPQYHLNHDRQGPDLQR